MQIKPVSEINFTAGKTRILSDFDGTFMPKEFNHDVICNNALPFDRDSFRAYFGDFDEFLKEGDEGDKDNELTISTGRNLPEFNYYMKKIKVKNLSIPVPHRLIVVNGGDEFISSDNKDYFSSNKKEMFELKDKNPDEQKKLSRFLISYDPVKIKTRVLEFLSNLSGAPKIFEPATHQGMYGYGNGLTLQEMVEKSNYETNYVSMRQDGDYQIRLTAPYLSRYIDKLRRLPDILEDDGYAIYSQINPNDGETFVNSAEKGHRKSFLFGTSVGMKPQTSGKVKVLDKFHHAKIMADDILQNDTNDLVIVAGDGRNDLPMLDLSNYSDVMKNCSDFSDPKFRQEAEKLPVRAIYVRNSESLDNIIEQFEENFNFDGKMRFIVVDKNDPKRPDTLLDAIKLAKEEYKKENSKYKEALEK